MVMYIRRGKIYNHLGEAVRPEFGNAEHIELIKREEENIKNAEEISSMEEVHSTEHECHTCGETFLIDFSEKNGFRIF